MHMTLTSLRRLRFAWIAFALSTCMLCGCQQWSLRKSMAAYFNGETPDDWEPPVPTIHEEKLPKKATSEESNRNWWGNRKQDNIPRVVLPRDRKEPSPPATASNLPTPPATSPNASVVQSPPAPQSTPAAPAPPAPSGAQAASNPPASSIATLPPSGLVAFGGNPNGEAGKVTRRISEESSMSAAETPAPPQTLDTGVEEIDVEGALQSLPPQYRQVVQRTLEAVKQGKDPETAVPPADPQPTAMEKEAKTEGAVSVRLSETMKIPTDIATPANPPASEVVRTSAQEPIAKPTEPPKQMNPAPATKSTSWHSVISEAIEKLEHELESQPPSDESLRRSQEMTLRMLYVAQRRLDDALRPIDRMDENEQEYVRHQMQALYEASNPDANPSRARHWSSVMMSQREATSHLAAVSNLEVRSVAFCTQVDGYGMYQRFGKYQFSPDQDVLLYCEVDNVAAEKVKAGYETQLQGSYEIRDAQGRLVADQDLPMEPEICLNHRRDYFMVYRIYMPQQIPAGSYELRLTIHDKKGGKYGHSSASFEIRK